MSTQETTTDPKNFQALIPFTKYTLDDEVYETVNARDLHAALAIGKDFTNWVKAQIKRAYLVENEDFVRVEEFGVVTGAQKGEQQKQGVIRVDYHLIIDAAKHVAMLSGTPKGREIRAYFIAAEKRFREGASSLLDQYPELASIQRSLVAIAEAKEAARIADEKAEHALVLSRQALEAQQWITLRQYIYLNDLQSQISDHQTREFARYLTGYCQEHGIPVGKEGVADKGWGAENRYHMGTIAKLLPVWLKRYYSQTSLEEN